MEKICEGARGDGKNGQNRRDREEKGEGVGGRWDRPGAHMTSDTPAHTRSGYSK